MTTTNEVIKALNGAIESVEAEESELAGGVRAVVPAEDAGALYRALRRNGFDFESRRGPSSKNIVANIEAEVEPPRSLGDLFR